jgi:hypothetical protein
MGDQSRTQMTQGRSPSQVCREVFWNEPYFHSAN